jgi:flavin reductase (DIM6/NTAB) family NADH-FMN oxidoreductase RutF
MKVTHSKPTLSPGFAAKLCKRAASYIPAAVAVLSSGDIVMTVSSLHFLSFEPALVSVAFSNDSRKGAAIDAAGRFTARLLRNGEERLATNEAKTSEAALLELHCKISERHPAGDHTLIIAGVEKVSVSEGHPLVYWRKGLHSFHPHYTFLSSRSAFEAFIRSWEFGRLPKAEWNHAAHVAVCAYYAIECPEDAYKRTSEGIRRYNEATGVPNTAESGFHETLTRFWVAVVKKFLESHSDSWKGAVDAVEVLGEERDLHHLYYSFDVVRDATARRTWVAPDLNGPYVFDYELL